MENKKLDKNSIIGFALIVGCLIWIMFQNQPTEKEIAADKAKKELALKAKEVKTATTSVATPITAIDTTVAGAAQLSKLQSSLGNFAYSATLPSAKPAFTTIENELVKLTVANKGGYIVSATLKNFERFKKGSKQLVELIKDNNSQLNIQFQTQDNHTLNTKDLFFEPTLTKVGTDQILSMRLKAGANEFLEYQYVLKPNDYMLDFNLRSQGLNKTLSNAKPMDLEWSLKAFRNEKSISYENRYATLNYEHEEGKTNSVSE
jgi:YidC/Oxa1 family membrane protein insertase